MIKCNVTVCGEVSRESSCRTNKDGKPFVSLAMNVVIPAKSGINKTVEVSVSKDGTLTEVGSCTAGQRVSVIGTLIIKKRGEQTLFQLYADTIEQNPTDTSDAITGELEFRGKVGKSVDEKTDKNGKPFVTFSAFSAEKVEDTFEYLWVRFLMFDKPREEWLKSEVRITAKGTLSLSVYNDKLDLTCRVSEISEYIPQPYNRP